LRDLIREGIRVQEEKPKEVQEDEEQKRLEI
jgi:hypothetical protein